MLMSMVFRVLAIVATSKRSVDAETEAFLSLMGRARIAI